MGPQALCAAAMHSSSIKRLDELFAAEPDRLGTLSFELAGLYFDWSKTHLDRGIVEQSLARAEKRAGVVQATWVGGAAVLVSEEIIHRD